MPLSLREVNIYFKKSEFLFPTFFEKPFICTTAAFRNSGKFRPAIERNRERAQKRHHSHVIGSNSRADM